MVKKFNWLGLLSIVAYIVILVLLCLEHFPTHLLWIADGGYYFARGSYPASCCR